MSKEKSSEQQLIDIMFEIAITSAQLMHGRTNQEIAEWVSLNLKECGFPTLPIGSSWGVLCSQESKK